MKEDKEVGKLFGVSEEAIEKSKDILPVLDLAKMEVGTKVKLEFLEKEPRKIETPNAPFSKTANVINVREISLGEGADQGAVDFSMFLSSKSLALGIARVYERNKNNLLGVKVFITITLANYKEGENRCYVVQQIAETINKPVAPQPPAE